MHIYKSCHLFVRSSYRAVAAEVDVHSSMFVSHTAVTDTL